MVPVIGSGIETVGKNVLVAGRSKNVGMPIAMLLHSDRTHERPGGEACVRLCVCLAVCVSECVCVCDSKLLLVRLHNKIYGILVGNIKHSHILHAY